MLQKEGLIGKRVAVEVIGGQERAVVIGEEAEAQMGGEANHHLPGLNEKGESKLKRNFATTNPLVFSSHKKPTYTYVACPKDDSFEPCTIYD